MISVAKISLSGLKKARQGILTSLFCLCVGLLITACEPADEFDQYQFVGPTMGTEYHISVVVEKNTELNSRLSDLIVQKLGSVNQSMSTYIADSEISLINQHQGDQWIPVSNDLFKVLSVAQTVSELSHGAFDITVAPLVNLWGFGPEKSGPEKSGPEKSGPERSGPEKSALEKSGFESSEGLKPSDQAISERLAKVGYQKLQLDSQQRAIRKESDLQLDLSAVAKGYGADQIADLLLSLGYANFMVEIGGELVVKGHSVRGTKWRIGIETPVPGQIGVQQAIDISDVGVATSGDYRNYFEQDGVRYSHTINPATGKPITHELASVTVIADTSANADALATAINVMGYAAGKTLAEEQQLAVYFIRKQGDHFVSDYTLQFKHYLNEDP